MCFFEKIGYEQFKKDVSLKKDLYEDYFLPKRATWGSCGYDFYAIFDIVIKPGEIKMIPTGYKVCMERDEFLMIVVRSSLGFKFNVRMCNQVGIVDSDYYNNVDNEGHIFVALQNEGEEEVVIKKGDAYVQGIFMKYLTCGEEEFLNRTGGIGSTNRKEDLK